MCVCVCVWGGGGSFSKTREVGYERASAKGDKFRYLPWLHIHNEIIGQQRPRAKRKVIDILMSLWPMGHTDVFLFFYLFDTQFQPALTYASKVGGGGGQLHIYVCKKVLSVSQKTPNSMSYGELRRHTLYRQ